MRADFAGIYLDAPVRWGDVSDSAEDAVPTLACDNGVGALQFSIAKFRSGKVPDIDRAALLALLRKFEISQSLQIEPRKFDPPALVGISGISREADNLLVVWYVSDGKNLAFVSYTALEFGEPLVSTEIEQADCIVASIEF